MIVLNRDGSLTTEGTPERAARWVKDAIEVPEDLRGIVAAVAAGAGRERAGYFVTKWTRPG